MNTVGINISFIVFYSFFLFFECVCVYMCLCSVFFCMCLVLCLMDHCGLIFNKMMNDDKIKKGKNEIHNQLENRY